MSFEVPLDKAEVMEIGGFQTPQVGYYHCYIADLNEQGGKNGEMTVLFQVLRGTVPQQEGTQYVERFAKTAEKIPVQKMIALAIACGLTTQEEIESMKKNGQRPEIEFTECIGKQVCVRFGESTDRNGKVWFGLHYDNIWHPFDKRANRIPLSAEWLASGGYVLPADRPIDGVTAASLTPKPPANSKTTGLERPAPGTPAQQSVADNVLADVLG